MSMNTNLHGRVRHTKLPKTSGLLPLFEAIVNSIHSSEEADLSSDSGEIFVEILRNKQCQLPFDENKSGPGREVVEDIIGFNIIDNGIGFNDVNMESFTTLDSEHKAEKGCRGVGRLLWLKAFHKVCISSNYRGDDGVLRHRSFDFSASLGVDNERNDTAQNGAVRKTCVHLDGFVDTYRDASRKTAEAIAKSLFEHCLWYFVRPGGAPRIIIKDETESILLDDIFETSMHSSAKLETISIKNVAFELTHIKLQSNSTQSHTIVFCAANRVVKEDNIKGKIPGLYGRLEDEKGEFVYSCYVSSAYLDDNVRSERTGFDIEDNVDGLFKDFQISFNDIRSSVIEKASDYLSDYLQENKRKGRERVDSFVSKTAPRYRPILSRIPEELLIVDPNISDKDLDLALHKHLAEIESKLLSDGHNIMSPMDSETWPDYQKRLQDYLVTAEDIKKSDLANYVSHRKVILDLLEKAIQSDKNGKYAREDLIHGLIMPMREDSNQVPADSCNLWLLDERLAFHDYLASDKTLAAMPITGNTETKEPDICVLNVFDNPILVSEGNQLPLASIVVIEIKRPMRNDAKEGEEKDPIEQALGYFDRIRNGGVTTAGGRPIPHSSDIPGYCYVVCDLTPSMVKRCKLHSLTSTSDNMGYFGYNPNYKAYIEVMSFDRLVNAAKERNRAFFDKLGLPAK
jgi:hypothetical protein